MAPSAVSASSDRGRPPWSSRARLGRPSPYDLELDARPIGLVEQGEQGRAVRAHAQAGPQVPGAIGEIDARLAGRGDAQHRSILLGIVGQCQRGGAVRSEAERGADVARVVTEHEALGLERVGHRGGRGLAHDGQGGEPEHREAAQELEAPVLALQAIEPSREMVVDGVAHVESSYCCSFSSGLAPVLEYGPAQERGRPPESIRVLPRIRRGGSTAGGCHGAGSERVGARRCGRGFRPARGAAPEVATGSSRRGPAPPGPRRAPTRGRPSPRTSPSGRVSGPRTTSSG